MENRILTNLLILCLLTITTRSSGQTEPTKQTSVKLEKGIGFISVDSLMGVNIRFRMQNRVLLTTASDEDLSISKTEALVKRLRLKLDGFLFNRRFNYCLQLGFSRSDQDWEGSQEPGIIQDAMIYYHFSPNFQIGFGQGKLPGNRQFLTSSGQQQFLDRSINNSAFSIDRDFGLFASYTLFSESMPIHLKGAISSGEGRNAPSTDQGYAYTGRIEWLPFGKFAGDGDFSEGDLKREHTFKLNIAGGYSLNQNARKSLGQRGYTLTSPSNITSLYVDLVMKYKGWALYTEYMNRDAQHVAANLPAENDVYVLTGSGFNTQISYLLVNNWEIAVRYTQVNPSDEIETMEPQARVSTLGINKYLKGHRVKMQLNLSRCEKLLPQSTLRNYQIGFQVEVGI